MAKSNEAFWWSLFAAGGTVAAFLLPVTVLLIGLGVPAGLITPEGLEALIHHPLTRLFLLALISLCLFHGGHRTVLTLNDMGFHGVRGLLAVVFYGGAILGTILAAIWLVRM